MNKPESNCFLLVIRTESRPVLASSSDVSTRSIAEAADAGQRNLVGRRS